MYLFALAYWQVGAIGLLTALGVAGLGILAIRLKKKEVKFETEAIEACGRLSLIGFSMSNKVLSAVVADAPVSAYKAARELIKLVLDKEKFYQHMREVSFIMVPQLMDENPEYAEKIAAAVLGKQKLEQLEDAEEERQKQALELLKRQEEDAQFAARAAKLGLVPQQPAAAPVAAAPAAKPAA